MIDDPMLCIHDDYVLDPCMIYGDPEWIFENDENDERGWVAIENLFAFLFSYCY